MLFLFILYSFGLTGMCARRRHQNYKQTCHRGVAANFLLSGVGIYFLLSWLVLFVCVCLFVPGILSRHFVCKPAIELEDNAFFNVNALKFSTIFCYIFIFQFLFFSFFKACQNRVLRLSRLELFYQLQEASQ
jgi:hypothetical protein